MSRKHFMQGLELLQQAAGAEEGTRARGFAGGTLTCCLKATVVVRHPTLSTDHPADCPIGALARRHKLAAGEVRAQQALEVTRAANTFDEAIRGLERLSAELDAGVQIQPEGSVSDPEALGSSPARNQSNRRRYGLKGLTSRGKSTVEQGCRLAEHDRQLYGFWTVTCPPEVIAAMVGGSGTVQELQRELGRELKREQDRRGLPSEAVAVAEVQGERFAAGGDFAVHWHLVIRARNHRRAAWAFTPQELDGLWRKVVRRVTGVELLELYDPKHPPYGNIQPIKRTVGGYLRKYMRKGSDAKVLAALPKVPPQLVPHQWWLMSDALKDAVKGLQKRLHPLFWVFVNKMEQQLKHEGLIFSLWRGKKEGSPPRVSYYFPNLEALAVVIARWQATDPSEFTYSERWAAGCAHRNPPSAWAIGSTPRALSSLTTAVAGSAAREM